jgi:hypothetical protein
MRKALSDLVVADDYAFQCLQNSTIHDMVSFLFEENTFSS